METGTLRIMLWGFGICVTGFLFLAGWMWWIVGRLHEKVSYDWIEKQFKNELNEKIDTITNTLQSIKDALIGDFSKKGIITKQDDVEKQIELMRLRCEKNHSE